ncbi:tyrosine-type recombinase/integrase [Nocardia sp. NPDC057663]|uniref:tyrosine-type recombinase/integrase n=1 Tax=Nocardia sp. NPDC057663 TaxID=3346201 RepID=UPI00366DD2B9
MLTELATGHWKARVSVRDPSGRRREVARTSPLKLDSRGHLIPDRTGQRALDAVLAAAIAITADHDGELSATTTVAQLWARYRDYLITQGRTQGTIARYDHVAKLFDAVFGGRQLLEVTTAAIESFLTEVGHARGPSNIRTGRTVLSGMFRYAVRTGPLEVNPVREAQTPKNIEPKGRTGGAANLTIDELRFILSAVRTSQAPCPRTPSKAERERGTPGTSDPPTVAEYCERTDLADMMALYAATGLRRSQMLGLVWTDIDVTAQTLHPTGKLVRIPGKGLLRIAKTDDPKNHTGTIALPEFAMEILERRKAALAARRLTSPPDPEIEQPDLVFPSTSWTLRDPQNVGHSWQRVREALGLPDTITPHSFRHAVATILDDAGISARVTADVLGHADPTMAQRFYMARGHPHRAAADVLNRAVTGRSQTASASGMLRLGISATARRKRRSSACSTGKTRPQLVGNAHRHSSASPDRDAFEPRPVNRGRQRAAETRTDLHRL